MINDKKVVALIQARCTSIRLPKKHFRYIGDNMLIDWVVGRLKENEYIDEIVISATNDISDIALNEYAKANGINFFGYSGDVNDVVSRHYQASKLYKADYIVVISGDCPLLDGNLINTQLRLLEENYDYCRPLEPCIHEGIDSYTAKCFDFINENSKTTYERENFGIIIRENPNLFNVGFFDIEEKYLKNNFRISVDNMADLRFMNKLFDELTEKNRYFNLDNVIDLVKEIPELLNENSYVQQKKKNEKTYKFLIKAEASEQKGLGHIKRMMALGQYLNENKNNGVLYAVNRDEKCRKILVENGYTYDYQIAESEKELIELINEYKPDFLIIDIQEFDGITCYDFEKIKKQTDIKKIILIDKLVENEFVDLMIIPGMMNNKVEDKVRENNKVLYGFETVFINNDFRKVKRHVKDEIVISFGGTDLNNITTKIIKVLNGLSIKEEYTFKIILGPYFKYIDELVKELHDFKHEHQIVINPNNFAKEIKNCKLGIIFYGVSFYEFKYLGIPTIDIVPSEEYEDEFFKLEKLGIGNYCGTKDELNIEKINKSINQISKVDYSAYKIGELDNVYERIVEVN